MINALSEIEPVVSVVMITYNHEKYIAEAIEGVLMQEVDFPIELIIADDCSPDGTLEIIQNLIDNHPKGHWINYTRHRINKGMMPNFVWALEQAKGKYIALCEGDDYWSDPLKLQKQIDFLEANEGYSICFHPAFNLIGDKISLDDLFDVNETINIAYLAEKGNFIHTASVVFRNNLFEIDDIKGLNVPAGDYLLNMLNAKKGLIKKLDEPMAVYRLHKGGVWSTMDELSINKKMVTQMKIMIPLFNDLPEVKNILKRRKRKYIEIVRSKFVLMRLIYRVRDSFSFRILGKSVNK